jgi:CDP-diacylglycerol---glycerol-3-phosphate 3-phosphatidyltransferase
VVNVSYTTDSTGNFFLPQHKPNPLKEKVNYTNTLLQQFKMFKYDNRVKIPSGHDLKIDDYFENLEKYNNNYRYRVNYENLIEFRNDKKEFIKMLIDENKESGVEFLKKLSEKESESKNQQEKDENEYFTDRDSNSKNSQIQKYNFKNSQLAHKPPLSDKVLIFPSFQFFNINQFDDQEILKEILKKDLFSKIRLSSGYLNLSDFIIESLSKGNMDVEVVTSSPQANSFYKAGFIKKNIPYFYRRYEQILLQKMKNKKEFSLYEFYRNAWSFHSKGFWFYEKERDVPNMTVIGSSNYSKIFYLILFYNFFTFYFCIFHS